MTASELKGIINEMGGYDNVFAFIFDNQMIVVFHKNDPLKEEDITTIGGVDVLKHVGYLRSKSTKKYNTRITNIHPLEYLQAIQFADDAYKRDDIDFTERIDLHS